jgi:signal transduction histidine kinase/CheY-like chemotaxis protein
MNVFLLTSDQSDLALTKLMHDQTGIFFHAALVKGPELVWDQLSTCSCELIIISEELLDQAYTDMKRLTAEFPDLSFIVLSSIFHEEHIIGHIRKGAQDYLVRGKTSGDELFKCLTTAYSRANLRNELIKARHEAEDARESNIRLLSRMSQEIRTPLNAISGMSEMLENTDLNSRQRSYIQVIRESGTLLVGAINDLIDYARIEAGKVIIHQKPFRIYDTIKETIEGMLPAAVDKKIELSYHVGACVPETMLGSDLRLRQVLMNLVDNAIKFTQHGHVALTAKCMLNQGIPIIRIQISDTGNGIAPGDLPNLFKVNNPIEDSNLTSHKGVRLGLAICKRLILMMHGEIEVESVPGKGSVFTISLPVTKCVAPSEIGLDYGLAGKKLLYLSSSDLQDELLADYTKLWGVEMNVVKTFEETPEIGNMLDDIDLLITQLRPGIKMDLKLIDRIRSFRPLPHILIKNPDSARDQLIVIRKDTVILTKPVDVHELHEVMVAVLNEQAAVLNTQSGMLNLNDHMGESHPLEILVAEDNGINQKIIQSVLNRYGYHPKVVDNGLQAIESLKIRQYDVVLMDIQMPGMDGLQACRKIREEFKASVQPRIIALTADALQQSREEYLQQGFDDLLYKPVQTKALMKMIAQSPRIRR